MTWFGVLRLLSPTPTLPAISQTHSQGTTPPAKLRPHLAQQVRFRGLKLSIGKSQHGMPD